MRTASVIRKTNETDISLKLELDGTGRYDVSSGNGFFNHMLQLFAAHGKLDIELSCKGDVEVDFHHSAEDIGIALGMAFSEALKNKRGIMRYADIILPMDEALVLCALDISGRGFLNYKVNFKTTQFSDDDKAFPPRVGVFDTELVEEFFAAFVRTANVTLHIIQLEGTNTHHILEAVFKAFGRVIRKAVAIDKEFSEEIPSTKGSL
jgi:Imidazoleglycerol-phosphate dehydratase